MSYLQTSNIRRALVCNKIVDHSDVEWASPVGATYIRGLTVIGAATGSPLYSRRHLYTCKDGTDVIVCFISDQFSCFSHTPAFTNHIRVLSNYICSITQESDKVYSSHMYSHMLGPGFCHWCPNHSNCSHRSFEAALWPIIPHNYQSLCNCAGCYKSGGISFVGRSLDRFVLSLKLVGWYISESRATTIYCMDSPTGERIS